LNKVSKREYLFRLGVRQDVDFGFATRFVSAMRDLPRSSISPSAPERWEILREGAFSTHEIVGLQR
jgi:hypothetical protein